MSDATSYGFAVVTFTRVNPDFHASAYRLYCDVRVNFTEPVDADELDGGELAWEAAEQWPESGWGDDVPAWGVARVTVTLDGVTTDVTPTFGSSR